MMFRYNNPDALLALLLTGAIYATMRGLERAQTKWLVLAGTLVGFGFITKMMQAFLILPVMAVVYLLAAPTGWWRRVWQVFVMGVSVLVAGGWWVAAVALTPAADRPYVGGSQNNSILNLIFGYNGFGRLTGNEAGSVGGGAVAGSMWGPTGLTRLFNAEFGNMMSWLLPGALVMGAVLLVITIACPPHRPRARRAVAVGWFTRLHRARHQPGAGHHPPLLHRRPGAAARRPGGDRHHGPVAAPRVRGRAGSAWPPAWPRRCLELRPARAHLGLVPRPATLRGGGGHARRRRHPGPPSAAVRPEARRRPRGGAGLRCRPGGAALLDGRHGVHPHSGAIPSVTPTASGGACRRLPGWPAGSQEAFARAGFGGGFPGGEGAGTCRRVPGWLPGRGRRHRARVPAGSPAACPPLGGGGFRRAFGRGGGAGGRWVLELEQSNPALTKLLQADAAGTRGSPRP